MKERGDAGSAISRRSVIQLGATAALAGAIGTTAAHAASVGKWDAEADIVVVGSGAAGGCAAARALELGRSVILLEKGPVVGGTTAKSGGGYWIFNNFVMQQLGIADPREDAIRLLSRLAYPQSYAPSQPYHGLTEAQNALLAAYYDNGARAVATFEKSGALRSVPYTDSAGKLNFPDASARLAENKAPMGRLLHPRDPSGKGGPPNGFGGHGTHLVQQLTDYVTSKGGRILTGHRVTEIVLDDAGAVIGIKAERAEGGSVAIRARRGVVFGSGGFSQNEALSREHLKGRLYGGCAVPTNQGDFLAIAATAGAAIGNMGNAWWGDVPVERALASRSTDLMFAAPGDSMFYVNKYGRRVVDEKAIWNERAQIHFVWDADHYEFPNQILFMIFDQGTLDRFAGFPPLPLKGAPLPPDILKADTLDALADMIDARMAALGDKVGGHRLDPSFKTNLAATRTRFDGFAANRHDEDFHRGELPASAWWHRGLYFGGAYDPAAPNDMLAPLTPQGPYYAMLLGAGAADTKGGPIINAKAQVLDARGAAIPGLYGAGNCIASPAGAGDFGGTLGQIVTFGFLAGENAAAEIAR